MKKRKPAKPPVRRKSGLADKPLLQFDADGEPIDLPPFHRAEISGVDVPKDFYDALLVYSEESFKWVEYYFRFEPWFFFTHFAETDPARFAADGSDLADPKTWTGENGEPIDAGFTKPQLWILQAAIHTALGQGFYLALARYADELKNAPEAKAIRDALARGRKKGSQSLSKKAEPKRQAVRKRFRELRKSGFSKTDARKVLEQETGISFRQLQRDTRGLA